MLQRSLCYPQLLYSSSGPTTDDVRFSELRKITLPDLSRAVFSVPLALNHKKNRGDVCQLKGGGGIYIFEETSTNQPLYLECTHQGIKIGGYTHTSL
jgi:hypothetical protein